MHRTVSPQQLPLFDSVSTALMIRAGEFRLKAAEPIEPTEAAIDELTHALRTLIGNNKITPLVRLQSYLTTSRSDPNAPPIQPPRNKGILAWDAQLANAIEHKNPACASLAADVRTAAKERAAALDRGDKNVRLFSLWTRDTSLGCCPYLVFYGASLWVRTIRNKYLKNIERERNNIAALPAGTATSTLRLHERGQRPAVNPDGTTTIYSKNDEAIAVVDAKPLSMLLTESLKRLASYDAQRLLRWEIFTAHEQRHLPDRRRIDLVGGWETLAKKVGISGSSAGIRVREIIDAQATMRIQLPGNTARTVSLLSYYERPATGQHPSFVQIVLGPILLPGYGYELRRTDYDTAPDFYKAQKLVPILPIPPLMGRKADWGAQCAFSSWIAVEMRLNAIQIEQRGSVLLLTETLQRLAAQASLPLSTLPALIARWTSTQHEDPPFLQQPEPHRFTLGLGPMLRAAWHHLAEAGRREYSAREHGKRAMHHRWKDKGAK